MMRALALGLVAFAACRGDMVKPDAAKSGTVCLADSECISPAVCVPNYAEVPHSGGPATCEMHGRICSRSCSGDVDCAPLGAALHCVASCDGNSSVCR